MLPACIPIVTATIRLEGSHGEAEIDRIESIVERLGFVRIWAEPVSGGRYARTKRDDELASEFETPLGTVDTGFGISIRWKKTDGSLRVIFAERNTRFSDRGTTLKEKLIDEVRALYGDKVSVQA